jgi:hypothetical protein
MYKPDPALEARENEERYMSFESYEQMIETMDDIAARSTDQPTKSVFDVVRTTAETLHSDIVGLRLEIRMLQQQVVHLQMAVADLKEGGVRAPLGSNPPVKCVRCGCARDFHGGPINGGHDFQGE